MREWNLRKYFKGNRYISSFPTVVGMFDWVPVRDQPSAGGKNQCEDPKHFFPDPNLIGRYFLKYCVQEVVTHII